MHSTYTKENSRQTNARTQKPETYHSYVSMPLQQHSRWQDQAWIPNPADGVVAAANQAGRSDTAQERSKLSVGRHRCHTPNERMHYHESQKPNQKQVYTWTRFGCRNVQRRVFSCVKFWIVSLLRSEKMGVLIATSFPWYRPLRTRQPPPCPSCAPSVSLQ